MRRGDIGSRTGKETQHKKGGETRKFSREAVDQKPGSVEGEMARGP